MPTQCIIEANPDIAGIGVRVSIYAQALLSLTPGIIFGIYSSDLDLTLDDAGVLEMTRSMLVILFTGTALLVSTIVQAQAFGLTVYHALIVLNLSWLNNLTAAGSLWTYWFFQPENRQGRDMADKRIIKALTSKEFAAYAIHFSATGAIGIWVFYDISAFGSQRECTPSLVYWIFGHDVNVTNPSFRKFWIAAFSLAAVPVLNVVLFCIISYVVLFMLMVLYWAVEALERKVTTTNKKERITTYASNIMDAVFAGMFVLSALIFDVLLILTTEMTIAHNAISSEESHWTFGQTLALILVVPLAWAVFIQAREVQRNVARRKAGSVGILGSDDMSLQPQTALSGHPLV